MTGLGVQVAVIRDDEVLLIQRRDFEVWGLPGGEIDPGETPAQAAIREVLEETGLEVRLTRLVGLYSMPQWTAMNTTIALFAGEICGGILKPSTDETIGIGFFAEHCLPPTVIGWHRQRIADALRGVGGSSVWTQDVPWPAGIQSRADLYALREQSNLAKDASFVHLFSEGTETADIEGKIIRN